MRTNSGNPGYKKTEVKGKKGRKYLFTIMNNPFDKWRRKLLLG